MVRIARSLFERGTSVLCTAFLDLCARDLCARDRCPQARREQLMPSVPGHFSHGTSHCRAEALAAGIRTIDVVPASLHGT